MKEKLKRWIAWLIFGFYQKGILKNSIRVRSISETVETLMNSQKSLVRFGDGEIKLIAGREIPFQEPDEALIRRLQEILQTPQENLLVALPDVFEDLSAFVPAFPRPVAPFIRRIQLRIHIASLCAPPFFFSSPRLCFRLRLSAPLS